MGAHVYRQELEDNTTAGLDPTIASFTYRKDLLCEELLKWDADVICLQEVQHFEEFFMPFLAARGYTGRYLKRTGDQKDGCALLWRKSRLKMRAAKDLGYRVSETFDRDNVGQVVALETVESAAHPGGEAGAGQVLVVGNTHVLFNPRRGDIKLQQIATLVAAAASMSDQIAEETGRPVPVILCGDFNTAPFSPIYEFLARGTLLLDRHQSPSQLSGQEVWEVWERAGQQPIMPGLRGMRGGTVRASVADQIRAVQAMGPVCTYNMRGACSHGYACRFSHGSGRPLSSLSPSPKRGPQGAVWSAWLRELSRTVGVLSASPRGICASESPSPPPPSELPTKWMQLDDGEATPKPQTPKPQTPKRGDPQTPNPKTTPKPQTPRGGGGG
ncbi:Endonuclease/exonuclease/phosphatase, partial [Baffinella frigidus]